MRSGLDDVYFLGGGSGAGKTTIARRVAARYGLRLYDTDAAMGEHAARLSPDEAPYLHRFLAMDFDQRWLHRPPRAMLDTFHWFRGEGFDLIVDDLLRLHRDRGVIAEGFRLLPELVAPLLSDKTHAMWLLPTAQFRRRAFGTRDGLWSIAGRTRDPPRALDNLLTRDALFTDRLRDDIARLGLSAIEVDSTMTEDQLCAAVVDGLGLGLSAVDR